MNPPAPFRLLSLSPTPPSASHMTIVAERSRLYNDLIAEVNGFRRHFFLRQKMHPKEAYRQARRNQEEHARGKLYAVDCPASYISPLLIAPHFQVSRTLIFPAFFIAPFFLFCFAHTSCRLKEAGGSCQGKTVNSWLPRTFLDCPAH